MGLERVSDLEALAPEWDALWKRCPIATPFQSPAWLLPWWAAFGIGELFSFGLRENDRLVALAPMFLHSWNGRRQVTFIGNGVSDHLDILAEPGVGPRAWTLMVQRLAELRDHWDVCDLQDVSEGSPLLASTPCGDVEWAVKPHDQYSVIALPETIPEFRERLPHGLRRNLRRYRTHLEAQGSVRFETAGQAQFDEYIEALFALHRARWHEKDAPGVLDGPGLEAFHRAAGRCLWNRRMVRFHALRLHEHILAVVYALVGGLRAYSYLGGFDPAWARFSPGALVMNYTIEQTILEGVREFDFLRGREAYKAEWGAQPRVSSRLILWHGSRPVHLLESKIV